jgi:phosphatidylserine/phosphatidylglycerophosphate/cardiolipin synthase-like enzyme
MTRLALLLILLSTPALADIQVAFSPGNAEQTVVQTIESAHRSVHVAAYNFTSRPIAQALIDAHRRGVQVEAVLDKSNARARYTEAPEVAAAGIPVRIDSRYPIMHDKFLVIDGVTVETGSFNYTAAAQTRNAENLIVLRDMPDVASRYEAEWERLWNESRDYPAGEAP